MKNSILCLFSFLCMTVSARAEVALLCGFNQEAIDADNDQAVVHVDFDDRTIKSKDEVKFLNTFGEAQEVEFARTNGRQTVVRTNKATYIFEQISGVSCDSDQDKFRVILSDKTSYPCACYED